MKDLKPGDKLRWKIPSASEPEYLSVYENYERWRKKHGEVVEFVAYAKKGDNLILHDNDQYGLPILRVKTKTGQEVEFSSGYFKK